MSKDFSTFADGSDCKECAALERKVKALKQRLAAAETALHEILSQPSFTPYSEICAIAEHGLRHEAAKGGRDGKGTDSDDAM